MLASPFSKTYSPNMFRRNGGLLMSCPIPQHAFERRRTTNSLGLMKNKIKTFEECCSEILAGEDVEINLKIILIRLDSILSQNSFESVMSNFPFFEFLELIRQPDMAQYDTLMFSLLARETDSIHFPSNVFEDEDFIHFLFSKLQKDTPIIHSLFHIFTYYISNFQDAIDKLIDFNILDYLDSNSAGKEEFAFILALLNSGIELESLQIQKIAEAIIKILSFSKKDNLTIQLRFKEFINSPFYSLFEEYSNSFLDCLKSGLGHSPEATMNTLTLISKIEDIQADEFVSLLIESANQFNNNEEFFCFVLHIFEIAQNEINEESFTEFIMNMLNIVERFSYNAEVCLAKTIAQSKFTLTKKAIINYLSKFIADDDIGNACVKKMGEILENLKKNNKQEKIKFLCKATEEDLESISLSASHADALDAFILMSSFPAYIDC